MILAARFIRDPQGVSCKLPALLPPPTLFVSYYQPLTSLMKQLQRDVILNTRN